MIEFDERLIMVGIGFVVWGVISFLLNILISEF